MEIKHRVRNSTVILIFALLLASSSRSQSSGTETMLTETKHVVLVHGGYHGAWCWYKVSAMLKKEGYTVAALDLTSHGIDKSIADDVTTVAQYAQPVVEYLDNVTEKVIVVGHSLGGAAVSYLMEKYGPEKIPKAIFLASAMQKNNESFITASTPAGPSSVPPDAQIPHSANGLGPTSLSFNQSYAREILYNMSPEEDYVLAKTLLVPTPYSVIVESLLLTPARYGAVRRFFILTENDMAVRPTVQENIIAGNPPERVFRLKKSDHCAFFSQPSAVTKLIQRIDYL